MGMRGGEIQEMEAMAKEFATQAGQLHQMINQLSQRAESSQSIWTGPGADRFRSAWQAAKPQFTKMADALHDASKAVQAYARNIEAATR